VDVFAEDYIRNVHEQVAYDNQGDTFVKEETNASYTEDSRQVHAIRWNPTLLIFHGRVRKDSTSESEMIMDLDSGWVKRNFGVRYLQHLRKIADEKTGFVMVPAGDVRDCHTLPAELVVPGAPSVKFLQGGLDICAAASMASVLSFIGQPLHA